MRAASPILKNGFSGIPCSSTGIEMRLGTGDTARRLPSSVVERVLEHLARLERQHATRADRDLLASLRVATRARVLVAHHEVAEAGDLDLLALFQGLLDGVEDALDDLGRFLLGKAPDLLVDRLDDIGLGHIKPIRQKPY